MRRSATIYQSSNNPGYDGVGESSEGNGEVSYEYFGDMTSEEREAELAHFAPIADSWVVPGADTPYWAPELNERDEYIMHGLFNVMPNVLADVLSGHGALVKANRIATELAEEFDRRKIASESKTENEV